MANRNTKRFFIAAIGFFCITGAAFAQDPEVKRMILQRIDVPDTHFECISGMAVLPPGMSIGRHTHSGVEVGYIAAGSIELMVEGAESKLLKTGDSYAIPPGTAHDARSVGRSAAQAMATWVVEKGKPLSQPAP
jgi:quercetin dioxygenase-like cupin family protein